MAASNKSAGKVAPAVAASHRVAALHPDDAKMEPQVRVRAHAPRGHSRVIIRLRPGVRNDAFIQTVLHGKMGRRLSLLNARVADLPDSVLAQLASHPDVVRIDLDRRVYPHMERTSATVGALDVRQQLGYDGTGVGVAVIDSGITSWHDDLTATAGPVVFGSPGTEGTPSQRVLEFVDFVDGLTAPYDDYGHGTHVAGIIAGNGYDSGGARAGVAPGASLVVLRVLDGTGGGYMSDVIAAIDYAISRKDVDNIRVINLSVGAPILQSYTTDPLTLAAKRAVDAGIVVVAAAGNLGRNAQGLPQYGGITAPGNAPWVLTVGASSHMGTVDRSDDTIAGFSSRGPTYLDYLAKPDLVAPGVGIESLSDPTSLLYQTRPGTLLAGTVATSYLPYESLSGTSMAAPVVSGTVALMLQANPALTPNAVKAILQYTAEAKAEYSALLQGAGFLNARGAVRLAQFFATPSAGLTLADMVDAYPTGLVPWGRHIIWGNYLLTNGVPLPGANAWALNIVWGSAVTLTGDNIVWGTACDPTLGCDNIVWGTAAVDNIVWGTSVVADNIVWGSAATDNIVWGSSCGGADCDNIVWGSSYTDANGDNIVWGSAEDGDNIVWGSADDGDNIVWGNTGIEGDNVVWGTSLADNIVWGSGGDNIVWGSGGDNIVWGNSSGAPGQSLPGGPVPNGQTGNPKVPHR